MPDIGQHYLKGLFIHTNIYVHTQILYLESTHV